jgi:hypothetical protein
MSLNRQFISRIALLHELPSEKNPSTKPMRMGCPVNLQPTFRTSFWGELD